MPKILRVQGYAEQLFGITTEGYQAQEIFRATNSCMLGDYEGECHAFALFCSSWVNLWPLLGQNTGLALWPEPAQLFIGFCITNSQSIHIPNQRCGCFQAQRTVHLVLLSANMCLNRSLLIQYRSLAHHYSRFLLRNLARCICMYACTYVSIY